MGLRGQRNIQDGLGAFCMSHPAVPATYVAVTLVLTMSSMQPALIAISLVGALAFGLTSRGATATLAGLRWQLPIILLIAVVNPLFSASGSTVLFYIGARAVYLESLCYGVAMGGMFVASVLWFAAAAEMLPAERVMALLGNRAPIICLMISMTMRLIPKFARRAHAIFAAQDAVALSCGSAEPDGVRLDGAQLPRNATRAAARAERRAKTRSRLRATSVLMGWSMEDSLETADAMRARGWGAVARRSTYARYRFTDADAFAAAGLVIGGALCSLIAFGATSQYVFYPVMSELIAWWGYVPYTLWMLLPSALNLVNKRRFG